MSEELLGEKYLQRRDAATFLGVSSKRLDQLRREGKITAVKFVYYLYSLKELSRAKRELKFYRTQDKTTTAENWDEN
jgi:hypothetical protein